MYGVITYIDVNTYIAYIHIVFIYFHTFIYIDTSYSISSPSRSMSPSVMADVWLHRRERGGVRGVEVGGREKWFGEKCQRVFMCVCVCCVGARVCMTWESNISVLCILVSR